MPPPPSCPCGSGAPYATCCEPLHEGADAATAEALMRSRFSAFAVGDAGYVRRTWHPSTRPADLELDATVTWTRLEVVDVVDGGVEDRAGVVEFRAHHLIAGRPGVLHERSTFARRGERWVYVDGSTE